jgi:hypothetical protein
MPAAVPAAAAESILAAEVMAAEMAAAAAAETAAVAAAETAATAAAETAATAAAEQAATAAATEAATAAGTQAATQTASGLEALSLGQTTPATAAGGLDALAQAQATQIVPGASSYTGATSSFAGTPAYAAPPPVAPEASTMLDYGMTRPDYMGGGGGLEQGAGTTGIQNPGLTPDQMAGPSDYSMGKGLNYESPLSAASSTPAAEPGFFDQAVDYVGKNKMQAASMGLNALNLLSKQKGPKEKEKYRGSLSKFKFNPDVYQAYEPAPPTPYQPRMYYAGGGQVEMLSNQNAIGANTGYPMADIDKGVYATPYQQPIAHNVVGAASADVPFASGGLSSLGGYSDGGRMLKGPGDGMSDNIPATIAGKQPARLANEEFVIPADVVSHLGNGSSEAGAKALYKMMDRVRQARTGNKKQGKQINPEKYLA